MSFQFRQPDPNDRRSSTSSKHWLNRRYRGSCRLWGFCFASLFAPPWLLFAIVCFSEYPLHRHNLPTVVGLLVWAALVICLGAALVGWLLHAVIVMTGGWDSDRQLDDEARDYDDYRPIG
jgi:hypothetical protein